eukprot:4772785-Prymnesium_polylepis.1
MSPTSTSSQSVCTFRSAAVAGRASRMHSTSHSSSASHSGSAGAAAFRLPALPALPPLPLGAAAARGARGAAFLRGARESHPRSPVGEVVWVLLELLLLELQLQQPLQLHHQPRAPALRRRRDEERLAAALRPPVDDLADPQLLDELRVLQQLQAREGVAADRRVAQPRRLRLLCFFPVLDGVELGLPLLRLEREEPLQLLPDRALLRAQRACLGARDVHVEL